jgi:hypothetical protein
MAATAITMSTTTVTAMTMEVITTMGRGSTG